MKINKQLLPQNAKNVPGRTKTQRYITIHNTANTSKGANAKSHANYMSNGSGGRQASWHYTVDDKEIWQPLKDTQQGWHAGDSRGAGNTQSIGIEICENADGDFEKAVDNAVWLVRKLMDEHGIPISNVVPHKKWSGKNCPRKLLSRWDEFIAKVEGAEYHAPKPSPVVRDKHEASKPTPAKPKSTTGQWANIQKTLNSRYGLNIAVDNLPGPETRKAIVKGVQTELNRQFGKGLAVDGIVGPKTRAAFVNVREGSRGNLTWLLQVALLFNGFDPGMIDGINGPKTQAAVKAFQRAKGLTVDGVAGKQTWSKLLG